MLTKTAPSVSASGRLPAGEILWLGTIAFISAIIVGIVGWPLSAELSPHVIARAPSGSPGAAVTPVTGADSTVAMAPSSTYALNRTSLTGPSLTTSLDVRDASALPIPSTMAPMGASSDGLALARPSENGPADQAVASLGGLLALPAAPPVASGEAPLRRELAPAHGPRPGQSVSASSPAHQL